jgi:hypothetical protein
MEDEFTQHLSVCGFKWVLICSIAYSTMNNLQILVRKKVRPCRRLPMRSRLAR